ncbi:hypothetical protein [Planctomyces sp. SH-PL62]|uniref:hypothetical protein n=1 Tax=Planctomyces sp. SH-PL62 TaxID=1636152 RepID=UPI00078BC185|nr:hypothetical protein [Planctomyces sp. SH-PL62]AMV37364.1 hypothetical protein VT85_08015 [Planctomyces sp. SH-PL62]
MAITIYKSGYLATPKSSDLGVGKFSVSVFLRMDEVTAFGMFHTPLTRGKWSIQANGGSPNTQQIKMYGLVSPTGSILTAQKPKFAAGHVAHFAMVYDKDDPTRQFMAVNGIKYPYATTSSLPIDFANVGFGVGNPSVTSFPVAFTVQDLLFLKGHAFSDEDLDAIQDHPEVATTIGDGPGVSRAFWTFDGDPGQPVTAGSPGITTPGVPALSFGDPTLATDGSSVAYSPRMAFIRAVQVDQTFVRSSGKTICVSLTNAVTGEGALMPPDGLQTPPTIRINGGPPIVLPTVAEGAYQSDECTAMLFPLPAGVVIRPGIDAVTISAPKGWAVSESGLVPTMVDRVVHNRAGRPSSMAAWPEAEQLRVGVNIPLPSMTYYDIYRVPKNLALHNAPMSPSDANPDGTYARSTNATIVQLNHNGIDNVGPPAPLGLYAVRWDDLNLADPVTITLTTSSDNLDLFERVEYRNDGAAGVGKVRVFELRRRVYTHVLASDVDASATTLTMTTMVDSRANSAATRDCFIVLGGEQIRVGSQGTNKSTVVGCTRGWNGTTPTSHAAGSPVEIRYANVNVVLTMSLKSTSGNLKYANLSILGPDNWTPPVAPGPASVAHVAWDDLDVDLLRNFSSGSGITRCMDSLPTTRDATEPEHVTQADDPHWASPRWADDLRIKKIRPFDPVRSPYVYAHIGEFPGAELYTATLGAPLAAADSESIETISIPDGDAAPVCYGSRLFIGGEAMRVVGEAGPGLYKVVRGIDDTAATAHPAGPIQVGWRIPITDPSQYVRPGRRFYEVVLDENSTPPRFGIAPARDSLRILPDCNITARRSLTLPNGVDATAVTFAVAPAEPGDWFYLAKGLTLVVGGETMTIASADESAGTVTVSPRTAGAVHAPGAAGATKSDLALFQDASGGLRVWKSTVYWACICLPTGRRSFLIHGELASGEETAQFAAGEQIYDPARTGLRFDVYAKPSIPYEMVGKLSSLTSGGWCWANVPFLASDSLVRRIAKAVRDNLPAGRKVVVELANEFWNTVFPFWGKGLTFDLLMRAPSGATPVDWWLLRQDRVTAIFREVFSEQGRAGEILQVIAWQQGQAAGILAAVRRLGIQPDAVSMAAYIAAPETAAYVRSVNIIDDEQACDLFATAVEFNVDTLSYRVAAERNVKAIAEHEAITGRKLLNLYYEGGLDFAVPQRADVVARKERSRDLRYNPLWYHVERDVYSIFRRVGKVDAYAVYAYGLVAGGDVGHLWGMINHPRQKPGYGDGRNGSRDNRLALFRKGLPNSADLTTGPDAANDSVRLQAWMDQNRDFFLHSNSTNPDPGTGPDPGTDPETGPGPNPGLPGQGVSRKPSRIVPLGSFSRAFRGYR